MTFQEFLAKLGAWASTTGMKLLLAVVVLILSFMLINWFAKKIGGRAEKQIGEGKLDKTLYKSISYIVRIVAKVLVVVALIGYLGFDTSGFAAILTSLGVGIGLAVNGTLSNFAGGILLLITRPFTDDDFIEACGYSGTVEDILICNTK
ncbi:MAG TPA: mechanosensitive ion channel protein MscS, partial [Clostridiales bacterium]|nr:mechanosensitive ion channel protein MscS [Clostridiales bacterium]